MTLASRVARSEAHSLRWIARTQGVAAVAAAVVLAVLLAVVVGQLAYDPPASGSNIRARRPRPPVSPTPTTVPQPPPGGRRAGSRGSVPADERGAASGRQEPPTGRDGPSSPPVPSDPVAPAPKVPPDDEGQLLVVDLDAGTAGLCVQAPSLVVKLDPCEEDRMATDGAEQGEDLELSALAREGVELLEGIVERGDPQAYQEVQRLLLSDTPKHAPTDGPEVDHPDQTPGPLPEDLVEVDDGQR